MSEKKPDFSAFGDFNFTHVSEVKSNGVDVYHANLDKLNEISKKLEQLLTKHLFAGNMQHAVDVIQRFGKEVDAMLVLDVGKEKK